MPDKIYRLIFQKDDGTEESVEFTAPQGPKGEQGIQGEKGETGVQGPAGQNGKDGVSATHSWNGTTLTVTSASGTSSANLKGEKGDKGDKGDQGEKGETGAAGSNGTNGKDGEDGTSPTVGISDITGGHRITITDVDGSKTFDVMDGVDANTETLPEYWETYLDEKISTIKTAQDKGGKDAVSYIVITDMHYPSNLGKLSPVIAKYIMDRCDIKFVLVLGDVRTRGLKLTKAETETEWADIDTMLKPIRGKILMTQGNHDAGYGKGDYDGDGDTDNYAYEFTPAEMFNRVYRKAGMVGNVRYDTSGTAYYIDDVANRTRYIMLNTHMNFDGNRGYESYETVADANGEKMAKYPSMWIYRYTQCQYDFLIEDALATVPNDDWKVVMGSHVPINQTGEMPEFPVMIGVLQAYQNKTSYSGTYAGTAEGGAAYKNLAEPLPNNTTDTTKWVNGYRFSSSGISSQTGRTVSNRIACTVGDVIRITGVALESNVDRFAVYYTKDGAEIEGKGYWNASSYYWTCTQVDDVYEVTILEHDGFKPYAFRFAMPTPTDASAVIVTVNQPIVEGGVAPYDAVSVNCDFTNAKGNLVAYHGGHNHKDEASFTCYQGGSINFPIITTRCDGQQENDATIKAERVAGTITEQSFDVFTVTPDKIYATKIGAGSDREISY